MGETRGFSGFVRLAWEFVGVCFLGGIWFRCLWGRREGVKRVGSERVWAELKGFFLFKCFGPSEWEEVGWDI